MKQSPLKILIISLLVFCIIGIANQIFVKNKLVSVILILIFIVYSVSLIISFRIRKRRKKNLTAIAVITAVKKIRNNKIVLTLHLHNSPEEYKSSLILSLHEESDTKKYTPGKALLVSVNSKNQHDISLANYKISDVSGNRFKEFFEDHWVLMYSIVVIIGIAITIVLLVLHLVKFWIAFFLILGAIVGSIVISMLIMLIGIGIEILLDLYRDKHENIELLNCTYVSGKIDTIWKLSYRPKNDELGDLRIDIVNPSNNRRIKRILRKNLLNPGDVFVKQINQKIWVIGTNYTITEQAIFDCYDARTFECCGNYKSFLQLYHDKLTNITYVGKDIFDEILTIYSNTNTLKFDLKNEIFINDYNWNKEKWLVYDIEKLNHKNSFFLAYTKEEPKQYSLYNITSSQNKDIALFRSYLDSENNFQYLFEYADLRNKFAEVIETNFFDAHILFQNEDSIAILHSENISDNSIRFISCYTLQGELIMKLVHPLLQLEGCYNISIAALTKENLIIKVEHINTFICMDSNHGFIKWEYPKKRIQE